MGILQGKSISRCPPMDKVCIDIHYGRETYGQDLKDAALDQSNLILLIHPLEVWNQLTKSDDPGDLAGELAGEKVPHLKAGDWSIFRVQLPWRFFRGWKTCRRGTLCAVVVVP